VSNGCMAGARSNLSDGQLACVRDHIRMHLATEIEVAELAGLVRLSPHYFSLVFRRAVGVSPHQYILQQRIGEARRLLTAGGMTLAELATYLGFSDQSHFSRAFRKVTGTTPRSFQTSLRSPWLLGTPRVNADAKRRACG
jgi:AraC family transcriptional regulator